MYHHNTSTQAQQQQIRIFSPVILFHDATAECISDHHVIQLKKRKVNAMLKTNGQFWSNVISSTRHPLSPPTSVIYSIDGYKRWYHTPDSDCISSSSSSSSSNNSITEEEEEEDIIEVVAMDSPKKSSKKKSTKDVNKKRRGNLPKSVTAILRQWLVDHSKHPYPTEEEKRLLRIETNLTLNQISNWFINARRRILPLIMGESTKRKRV
ncbi:unnamed protein product [Mucor hiemalis]